MSQTKSSSPAVTNPTKKTAKKVARKPRKPKEPPKFLVEITSDQLAAVESIVNGVDELLYSMDMMPSMFGPKPSKPTPGQKMMSNVTDFITGAQDAQAQQDDLKNGWLSRRVEEQRKEALEAVNQVLKPTKNVDNETDKQAALEHAKSCLEKIGELL